MAEKRTAHPAMEIDEYPNDERSTKDAPVLGACAVPHRSEQQSTHHAVAPVAKDLSPTSASDDDADIEITVKHLLDLSINTETPSGTRAVAYSKFKVNKNFTANEKDAKKAMDKLKMIRDKEEPSLAETQTQATSLIKQLQSCPTMALTELVPLQAKIVDLQVSVNKKINYLSPMFGILSEQATKMQQLLQTANSIRELCDEIDTAFPSPIGIKIPGGNLVSRVCGPHTKQAINILNEIQSLTD